MSQSPLSSLQEKLLLVFRPLAESCVVLALEPGMRLVLEFEPDQAVISRDHDNLVFSLANSRTVTVAGFFAHEGPLPAFVLPDGSIVPAEAFFEAFSPELSNSPNSAKADPAAEDALDAAVKGVQGLGALGTFYWDDGKLPVPDDADLDSMLYHMDFFGSSSPASYLYAQNNHGTLIAGVNGMQTVEVFPGYYVPGETYRENVPLPGNDDSWDVSGALASCKNANGEEKTGITATSGAGNPFEDSGFDIEGFIRDQSPLADWAMDTDNFGCMTREVSVAENAATVKISIDWSMLANGNDSQVSDVTVALLFKVGDEGELVYMDHATMTFGDRNADGTYKDAVGHASWNVDPGERYTVALVMAGMNLGVMSNSVLAVDALEQSWQMDPIWVEPVYEDVPVAVYSALGNVISDPLGDGTPPNGTAHASGVDYHSDGLAFSVTRFFLNGEWREADGEAVNWQDETGTNYAFTMDAQGEYSFSAKGTNASSPEQLDVMYEIKSTDGLKDQATLYLRGDGQTAPDDTTRDVARADAESGDATHGALAADASPGTHAWDGMTLAQENPLAEIFSMAESDWLFFADLLNETEELELLLESGGITLSSQGETLSLDIVTDAGEDRHIDVTMEKGAMESFANEYTYQNGTTEGMEQALLQLILSGS